MPGSGCHIILAFPCQISDHHINENPFSFLKFDSIQSWFTSLPVIEAEVQETVNHGYRKNLNEHVVRFVELGENIHEILMVDFCQGVVGCVKPLIMLT